LSSWAEEHQVQLPYIPDYCEQSYHMFYMIMPSSALRDAMIQHLKRSGIMAVFHYVPLHESQMGQRLAPNAICPVTSRASSCLLRLPFYNDLSESNQSEVLNAIQRFDAWKDDQAPTARAAIMAQ
jgi:dTDP-4-amino-4,6-dideoxygalactose transaminase